MNKITILLAILASFCLQKRSLVILCSSYQRYISLNQIVHGQSQSTFRTLVVLVIFDLILNTLRAVDVTACETTGEVLHGLVFYTHHTLKAFGSSVSGVASCTTTTTRRRRLSTRIINR